MATLRKPARFTLKCGQIWGQKMRAAITLLLLFLVPVGASAQSTTITITNSACTNPPPPAEVPPPVSPSIAAGSVAARNREFALARANFSPLADQGNPDAQRAMGQLLMQDCTGMQDKALAVNWLTKAAATGNVMAEIQLARAYLRGFGVTQDDSKAFALYAQAAATVNPIAQMEVGYMYNSGRGVAQDKYQGLQWSVKAAEQGNAVALSNIAHAYFKGEVLPRNVNRAAYFLALANQRVALVDRNEMMATSQEIRQAISVEDLSSEAKRAQRWSPGPSSLSDVLSEAEDFRRHHS
jgi:hypothetical protein